MVTKELCTEIERLGKRLTLNEIAGNLGLYKSKVRELIKKYGIPYKQKTATQSVRRKLTRKLFRKRVKANYAKADCWLDGAINFQSVLFKVVSHGRVVNEPLFETKVDIAWGRRSVFSLGYTEEVE